MENIKNQKIKHLTDEEMKKIFENEIDEEKIKKMEEIFKKEESKNLNNSDANVDNNIDTDTNMNNNDNNNNENMNKTNNFVENFEEQVKKYVSENDINFFILTPCYGGMCHVDYSLSLIQTLMAMVKFGIKTTIEVCRGDSLVTRARNGLIAKAMARGATHLFFIDSDIIWKPIDVLKLLIADEKLIGGIYPKKKYNWEIFEDREILKKYDERVDKSVFNGTLTKSDFPQCKLINYNFITESKSINIQNNLMELKHLPTGFMMIKRCVIEDMMKEYPETKYTDDSDFLTTEKEQEFAYALFDCGIKDKQYLSEDWLFCDRYKKMGEKIYANVTIDLIHVGVNYYKGKTTSIFV